MNYPRYGFEDLYRWAAAHGRAVDMARVSGRRWYVRGYRTVLGRWRYGAYAVRHPDAGREW